MAHQSASHQYSIVVKEEEARRLKLQSVLLRDENAALKDGISSKDDEIARLLLKYDEARSQLETTTRRGQQQEKLLRGQARELAGLKDELNTLNNVAQDSAKMLTEKLALSREVALLKPEVEHLRSQANHQMDVLSEKLALERQLNAMEAELANEKRANQNAASQRRLDNEAEEELRNQIHGLEKQLAREKRAAQKAMQDQESKGAAVEAEAQGLRERLSEAERLLSAEKQSAADALKANRAAVADSSVELEQLLGRLADAEAALAREKNEKEHIRKESDKAMSAAETRYLSLEERLDNAKARLRETREELKQCRADFEKAQKQAMKKAGAKAAMEKKRRGHDISMEETLLHTPKKDEERPKRATKRGFGPAAAVGEKSTFSITPFLNKTINMSDLSPNPQAESTPAASVTASVTAPPASDEEPAVATEVREEHTERRSKATARGRPTAKALAESSLSKKNAAAPRARKPVAAASTLEKVTEVDDDGQEQENRPAADATENPNTKGTLAWKKAPQLLLPGTSNSAGTAAAVPQQADAKKKKRKLLGGAPRTLFDEEADGDDAERGTAPEATRRAPARVALGRGGGAAAKKAAGPAGVKNALAGGGAAFSPLKRDRRGVNASFLA